LLKFIGILNVFVIVDKLDVYCFGFVHLKLNQACKQQILKR